MIVAKEDEVVLVLDDQGVIGGDGVGVYRRDTRLLKTWKWELSDSIVLATQAIERGLLQHVAAVDERRVQKVGLERRTTVRKDGFDECLRLRNTSMEFQSLTLKLTAEGEFLDIFSRWVEDADGQGRPVEVASHTDGCVLRRVASDGVESCVTVRTSMPARSSEAGVHTFVFDLEPGRIAELHAAVEVSISDAASPTALPSYQAWRAPFAGALVPEQAPAYDRAVDDLRLLMLSTPQGAYPAAGAPWFVARFGRDALITAFMLLRAHPELAASVLRTLAADQGRLDDPFTEEAPGKILHEVRRGELSRTRRIPFARYYGSIDATPLFVMLLGAYVERTGDEALMRELLPVWTAAIAFIERHDDADGLLAFDPSGSGLGVQSWKDSSDSMNHADGAPAEVPLSVVEVQAYAVAALRVAAGFHERMGEPASAAARAARADALAQTLHRRFWMDDLETYAMALDRYGRPLRVLSSDAGHLLWCGVVPKAFAGPLVKTLMSEALWSGWGLRTLGAGERRYNPVSYHNGGVWPHDTAIFAGGLARYGFRQELETVARALFDLAAREPLQRMPELVSGFARELGLAPIPYTHACKPQAWAAAALAYVTDLVREARAPAA